jgi:hypothetical protein
VLEVQRERERGKENKGEGWEGRKRIYKESKELTSKNLNHWKRRL